MKLRSIGPGRAEVVLEPGDHVALLDEQDRIIAGPDPLPTSREIEWEVPVAGAVRWALLDEQDHPIYTSGTVETFGTPGGKYQLCAVNEPAQEPVTPEDDRMGSAGERREHLRVAKLRYYGAGMSACQAWIAGIVGVMAVHLSRGLDWPWLWWLAIPAWIVAVVFTLNGVLSWMEASRNHKAYKQARGKPD